jgi:MFS family permease
MLAFIGFFMSTIAQSAVAFDLTGNNRDVGAVVFGQGLAMIVLAPFGGALADRMSKRMLLVVSQSVIAAVFLLTGVLIGLDAISILALSVGSFVIGTMFSLLGPTRQAYVGYLVEPERRGNAVALQQVALNAGRVGGPFVAAGLLAIPVVAATGTYLVMGVMYLAAMFTLAMLPAARGRAGDGTGLLDDVVGGVRYVARNARLRALILQFVLVMLAGFPFITVMPAFVDHSLGSDTSTFGLLMGIMAIGGLIASLGVAPIADSARAPQVIAAGCLGFGVSLIATGIAPNIVAAAVTMFMVGLTSGAFQTLNNAVIVREAAAEYYGRVMSLTMMAFAGFGIIALPVGFIADAVGERQTIAAMGIAVCATTVVTASVTLRTLQSRGLTLEEAAASSG